MDRGRAPFPRICDGGAAASGDLGKSSALHRRRRNRVKKQMCFFFSLFVLISPITFSHVYSFFFRIVYIAFVRDTGCTVRFCLFTVFRVRRALAAASGLWCFGGTVQPCFCLLLSDLRRGRGKSINDVGKGIQAFGKNIIVIICYYQHSWYYCDD